MQVKQADGSYPNAAEALRGLFITYDRDSNGRLQREEFQQAVLSDLGLRMAPADIEAAFKHWDKHGRATISWLDMAPEVNHHTRHRRCCNCFVSRSRTHLSSLPQVTQHRHFKYFFNKNGLRQLKAMPPPSGSSSSRGGGRAGAGHPCRQPSGSQSARDPASSGIRPSPPLCRYTKFGLHSARLPRRASAVPTSPVRPQDPSSRAEVRPKGKLSRSRFRSSVHGAHHVPFRPSPPAPLSPP